MLWSFSVSQGLHLHVSDQTTASSPKALRKYDFRLLTPSTGATFHRRGHAASGTSSSVTQATRSLVACGRRCVLSLRPERCGNKTENEKSKDAEESEGGANAAYRIVDENRKRGEEKKRAQSCGARTRTTVMSDARPSSAPALTPAGRSDVNALEGSPGYRMVWRHRDPLDCSSTGNPVLHLYLPTYPTDPRKDTDEVLDAETDQKTEKRIQPEDKEGTRTPDVLEGVVTTETGSEQKSKTEENGERRRGSHNKQRGVRKKSYDFTQEPGEEHSTEEEEEEHSGKSDDTHQCTADVLEKRPKAPSVKLNSEVDHVRNSTRRPTLSASALFIPGTLARTRPSPSPCMPPPFYGSSFGHHIRTPHTPERHRAKSRPIGSFSFNKRAIKPVTQKPPCLDRTGSRHVFKTEPRGISGPRPKITSCERWGPLPRKTKTTKTFVWGPRGPQESKSVCELQARTNRWRGVE